MENLTLTQNEILDSKVSAPATTIIEEVETQQVPQEVLSPQDQFENDPRDLAFESLYTLQMYLSQLIQTSRTIPAESSPEEQKNQFDRLMEGLQLLIETIHHCRQVIQAKNNTQEHQVIEADFLSILRDLYEANQSGDQLYRDALLKEYLPNNLIEWREQVIPSMVHSRDQ